MTGWQLVTLLLGVVWAVVAVIAVLAYSSTFTQSDDQ